MQGQPISGGRMSRCALSTLCKEQSCIVPRCNMDTHESILLIVKPEATGSPACESLQMKYPEQAMPERPGVEGWEV